MLDRYCYHKVLSWLSSLQLLLPLKICERGFLYAVCGVIRRCSVFNIVEGNSGAAWPAASNAKPHSSATTPPSRCYRFAPSDDIYTTSKCPYVSGHASALWFALTLSQTACKPSQSRKHSLENPLAARTYLPTLNGLTRSSAGMASRKDKSRRSADLRAVEKQV